MNANQKPPVDWELLKQIRKENRKDRDPMALAAGALILGLALGVLLYAFFQALDPLPPTRDVSSQSIFTL